MQKDFSSSDSGAKTTPDNKAQNPSLPDTLGDALLKLLEIQEKRQKTTGKEENADSLQSQNSRLTDFEKSIQKNLSKKYPFSREIEPGEAPGILQEGGPISRYVQENSKMVNDTAIIHDVVMDMVVQKHGEESFDKYSPITMLPAFGAAMSWQFIEDATQIDQGIHKDLPDVFDKKTSTWDFIKQEAHKMGGKILQDAASHPEKFGIVGKIASIAAPLFQNTERAKPEENKLLQNPSKEEIQAAQEKRKKLAEIVQKNVSKEYPFSREVKPGEVPGILQEGGPISRYIKENSRILNNTAIVHDIVMDMILDKQGEENFDKYNAKTMVPAFATALSWEYMKDPSKIAESIHKRLPDVLGNK